MIAEAQTYIERFRELRGNTLKTLDALDASGLNYKPTRKATNSLFILATHLLGSERGWIHQFVGQRDVQRDREAEFSARGNGAEALKVVFETVARTSEEILGALSPADLDMERRGNYGTRTVRWGILHMIEHYSEHYGQMCLTRQLWQAQQQSASSRRKATSGKTKGKRKK
jgi:uncharacterized damage-inducible protein DinB